MPAGRRKTTIPDDGWLPAQIIFDDEEVASLADELDRRGARATPPRNTSKGMAAHTKAAFLAYVHFLQFNRVTHKSRRGLAKHVAEYARRLELPAADTLRPDNQTPMRDMAGGILDMQRRGPSKKTG
jgi:hypothetical protein